MMSPEKPLRIAILGARGIGRVHARIFHALGANLCAVLGSSEESAAEAAGMLKDSFAIRAQPFSHLGALLDVVKPNAISICTPPHLHFDEIIAAFDRNIPVFCEKPLFWNKGIIRSEVEEKLTLIETHSNRRLFVNTSNSKFVDHVQGKIDDPRSVGSFYFRFYTQGAHLGRDIGFDLLPHGLSLLLRLLGHREIRDLSENVGEHTCSYRFSYGECAVEFDFQEIPAGPRYLIFTIDGRTFTRIQEGRGATYRVFLKDSQTGKKQEIQDPFYEHINLFLNYCTNHSTVREDEFDESAINLRLMADILLRGS